MTDRRLTVDLLRHQGACEDQIAVFALEWPDGVVPPVKAVRRALALGLDVEWAAEHCFSAPAWAAYEQACAVAWVEAWNRTASEAGEKEIERWSQQV